MVSTKNNCAQRFLFQIRLFYPYRSVFIIGLLLIPTLAMLTGCPAPTPPPPVETVQVELVAQGFVSPIFLTTPDDQTDRLFIVDQVGRIYIVDGAGNLLPDPFLDLSDEIVELDPLYDERGLLGLAFHPQFAINQRFFVFYVAPPGPETPEGFNSEIRVSEFLVSPLNINIVDPASERILLTIDNPQANNNGGTLTFGPDGFLYISVGDGGGSGDVGPGHTPDIGNAQDKTKLLGKILRIDVDSILPYAIPVDNPFVIDPDAQGEIWAYGLRNPYRISFDQQAVNDERRLFAADIGQELVDEVDLITRGGNYGWNIKEGTFCFNPDNPTIPPAQCPDVGPDGQPLIDPIFEYIRTVNGQPFGIAVIGGFIYRGSDVPRLQGQYIFGDLSRTALLPDGTLLAAREDEENGWTLRAIGIDGFPNNRLGQYIKGFGQDNEGEIYITTSLMLGPSGTTGRVYRIAQEQQQ